LTQERRLDVQLDAHTRLSLSGSWWSNQNDDEDHRPAIDLAGRGGTARAAVARKIGPLLFSASAALDQVSTDMEGGRGTSVAYGLSISYSKRLSRSMTLWVALQFGQRRWLGTAPSGEANSTGAMLWLGMTWP
jgi:hypothetical protein